MKLNITPYARPDFKVGGYYGEWTLDPYDKPFLYAVFKILKMHEPPPHTRIIQTLSHVWFLEPPEEYLREKTRNKHEVRAWNLYADPPSHRYQTYLNRIQIALAIGKALLPNEVH